MIIHNFTYVSTIFSISHSIHNIHIFSYPMEIILHHNLHIKYLKHHFEIDMINIQHLLSNSNFLIGNMMEPQPQKEHHKMDNISNPQHIPSNMQRKVDYDQPSFILILFIMIKSDRTFF